MYIQHTHTIINQHQPRTANSEFALVSRRQSGSTLGTRRTRFLGSSSHSSRSRSSSWIPLSPPPGSVCVWVRVLIWLVVPSWWIVHCGLARIFSVSLSLPYLAVLVFFLWMLVDFFWDWNSALRARECDQSVVGQSWNQKLPEEQPCRQEDFFWGGRSHSELGEDDDDREENNEKCS